MATFTQSWLSSYAKNHREYENLMRDKMREHIKRGMLPPPIDVDATTGYYGGGNTGMMGVSGSVGPMGMQGVQGVQGSQGLSGQAVFKQDVNIAGMSLTQFVHRIPASSIEEAFVELAQKYGLYTVDAAKGYEEQYDPCMNEDEGLHDGLLGDNFEQEKTFTLDEVINLIDSLPTEMNINHGGVFEFTQKQLIDKNRLKEILRNS